MCLNLHAIANCWNSLDAYCGPLSDFISSGIPNLENIFFISVMIDSACFHTFELNHFPISNVIVHHQEIVIVVPMKKCPFRQLATDTMALDGD